MHPADRKEPAIYQIIVNGRLEPDWSDYFGGLTVTTEASRSQTTTTLAGELLDQAALMGALEQLYNCGIALLSVECVSAGLSKG